MITVDVSVGRKENECCILNLNVIFVYFEQYLSNELTGAPITEHLVASSAEDWKRSMTQKTEKRRKSEEAFMIVFALSCAVENLVMKIDNSWLAIRGISNNRILDDQSHWFHHNTKKKSVKLSFENMFKPNKFMTIKLEFCYDKTEKTFSLLLFS